MASMMDLQGKKYRLSDIRNSKTSLLRTLEKKDKSSNSEGQLSRWWVFEHVEEEVEEHHHHHLMHDHVGVWAEGGRVHLPFLIFNPTSRSRIVWDSIVFLLLIYNMCMIPFRLAFSETQVDLHCKRAAQEHSMVCPGRPWLQLWNEAFWFWLDLGFDAFFICDILINFLTTYEFFNARGEKELEVRRGVIAWRYCRSWFPVDLISSVPVEPILFFAGVQGSSTGSIFRVLRLLRLLKLLRLWRIGVIIKKLKDFLDIHPALVRMVQLLTIFTVLAHWLSCMLFWVGTFYNTFRVCDDGADCYCWLQPEAGEDVSNCSPVSWTISKSFVLKGKGEVAVADMDADMQYLITFYWVITTMTTVGYGDITPSTFYEFAAAVLMQVVGVTVFGFMVGNMATLSLMLQGRQGQLKQKINAFQAFLQTQGVPKPLQHRVLTDMEHFYRTPNVVIKRDIIDCVPTMLASDVARNLFQMALDKAPIFHCISHAAKQQLYLRLQPFHVAKGDILVSPGEVSRAIIFVLSGSLSIFKSDTTQSDKKKPHAAPKLANSIELESSILARDGHEDQPNAGEIMGPLLTLLPGSFIGEECLVAGKSEMGFCAKANAWSNLLSLGVRDIVACLESSRHKDELKRLRLTARMRSERFSALLALSSGFVPKKMSFFKNHRDSHRDSHQGLFRGPVRQPTMHFKATADESKPGQAEVETNASSFQHHSQHQALRNMLQGVDLNENQRQMLDSVLNRAYETGRLPVWEHLLGPEELRKDVNRLVKRHGGLTEAEKALSGDLPPDVYMTLNLGLRDEFGEDVQTRLECKLANILRRLHKTQMLCRSGEDFIRPPLTTTVNSSSAVEEKENTIQGATRGGREATNAVSPAQVRGWVHFLGLYQRTKVSTVTVSTCRSYDYYVEKSASHVLFALLHRVLSI